MPKNANTGKDVKIQHLLERGVEQVIERDHLEKALRSGKKLRVKLGIDPTGKKIHIGRAVVLWKLREFQELGHKVIFLIGDYTATIGDPSDKLEKRPILTKRQIQANLKDYLPQVGKILDLKKVEVRYNSEWLSRLKFEDILELTDLFTASQIIERRNFRERWEKDQEISLREFMYPLMQGYDSFALKADVELGGTDQLFNLLAGRKIQKHYGQKPQDILLTAMLTGTDGRKMSTSWGNVINISDDPDEQYGKAMSMHDDLIVEYAKLATDMDWKENKNMKGKDLKDAKQEVAFEIVRRYHGESAARSAAEKFEQVFAKKELDIVEIPELKTKASLTALDLVVLSGVVKSKSDARRIIQQGGVGVDEQVKKDPAEELSLKAGSVVKIGKKSFFRIARE
jgi:tyrosyl-tRNA synthetase